MITFLELWYFIETTRVTDNVLELIDPDSGSKICSNTYIIETFWEKRFNIQKLKQYWELCYTFIVNGSCITPSIRQLIEEVENDHNVDAQAHIYTGKVGSKSFAIHADIPDNLIVQCIGKSKVTVYDGYATSAGCYPDVDVTIKEQHILEPGNSIYIPSLQYHLFEPLTDRLSISIPMIKR
jgi:ribosomal protein L16 Arg81 hydroxylase